MVNTYISQIFSNILSVVHVAVIGVLVFVFFAGQNLPPELAEFGMTGGNAGFYVIGIFLVYVLIAGFLATVVSINNQLIKSNKNLIELKKEIVSICTILHQPDEFEKE